MIKIDCDFHIHSRFSAATSNNMNLENISKGARQKGLHVVATGDALNRHWLEEIESLEFKRGVGRLNDCHFILTTEVEDKNRVHHLVLFQDIHSVYALRESIENRAPDIDADGRPHLRLGGEEIARACHEAGAMIGPSHAFVPWTSIYKEYDSIKECYGEEDIDFLELGLSADTHLAGTINELEGITFLSNSDAHSPQPHRLGREFNRLEVEKISFEEIKKAILGRDGRGVVLNVGLDPRLGKYHRTACIKCYTYFSLEEAAAARWRCPHCSGTIKKGVFERIGELKDQVGSARPPYLRIAPLAEIIAKVLGVKSVYSVKVSNLWSSLVDEFGSEITVLIDAPLERIREIDPSTAEFIRLYREERFTIKEGGGGRYGEILFEKTAPAKSTRSVQKSIDSF